jgi:hypothetical protein
VFSNVTIGNNDLSPFLPGTHQALGCCSAGAGFDYASGLGSPNLAILANLASALQPPLASVGVSVPRQRPLKSRSLKARVSCSRACLLGAYANIAIGRDRTFTVRANTFVVRSRGQKTVKLYVLRRKGRKTVTLRFSGSEARRIRAGVRAHKAVYAYVYGVIVDSGGNVEVASRAHRLRIRG